MLYSRLTKSTRSTRSLRRRVNKNGRYVQFLANDRLESNADRFGPSRSRKSKGFLELIDKPIVIITRVLLVIELVNF